MNRYTTNAPRDPRIRGRIIYEAKSLPSHVIRPSSNVFEGQLEDPNDLFKCGICLERIADPRILPCHHRFCRVCIHKTILFTHEKRCEDEQSDHGQMIRDHINSMALVDRSYPCPTCRHEFSTLDGFFRVDEHMTDVMNMIAGTQRKITSFAIEQAKKIGELEKRLKESIKETDNTRTSLIKSRNEFVTFKIQSEKELRAEKEKRKNFETKYPNAIKNK